MAIDFDVFFARAGHVAGIGPGVAGVALTNKDLNYYRTTTVPAKVSQVETDFATSPEHRSIVDGLYAALGSWQGTQDQFIAQMQTVLQQLLITTVDDDIPQSSLTVAACMPEFIRQMGDQTVTVKASSLAVVAQASVGTPVGNPVLAISTLGTDGKTLEYLYDESVTFQTTQDGIDDTGLLDNETLTVTTPALVSNPLAWQWPNGSGANVSLSLADATSNEAKGNLLQNSDYETWTVTNIPDNWTLLSGSAAGTDVLKGSSPYTGSFDLQLASGTSSTTLSGVRQEFGNAPPNGSASTLTRSTVYGVNFVCKVSAVPSAGVLEISLVNVSNTIISDDAGTENKVQVTLSGETTAYAAHTAFFRLPTNMPAAVYLRVRLSTALDNAKSVHVDHLCLTPAVELYTPKGPWVAGFSMSTRTVDGDTWRMAITNTWGRFQQVFERVYGMRSLGLQLPSAGSPSINDNLIA